MKYKEFENLLSPPRIGRFARAMGNDNQKTMVLYRYNIYLSQKLFGIMHVFEIALRNKINTHYIAHFGQQRWLYEQSRIGGAFYGLRTSKIIDEHYNKLLKRGKYTNDRLVSDLPFGFWTTLFDRPQFRAGGQNLHNIFPNRPSGTQPKKINQDLDRIRQLRNRVAHHQPLCFNSVDQIDMLFAQEIYNLILQYTEWMGYDNSRVYQGLDHVQTIIDKIRNL
jgi:hypothetical protein